MSVTLAEDRPLTASAARDGAPRGLAIALGVACLAAVGVCLHAIAPLLPSTALVLVFAWVVLPGVLIARRVYGAQPRPWIPACLVGPIWGFAFSSLALLALWVAGVRQVWILALAPPAVALLALPARRIAGELEAPTFDRRDVCAVLLVLLLLPLTVGRPFSRVGEIRPEGRAYRAYFTADLVWAMAVVAELSKGDVLPHNPFRIDDHMHYYWLVHLVSSIEHREAPRGVTVEQILLTNAVLLDLAYLAVFYFFVRQFVGRPFAAAFACISAVLFQSFEGAQQLLALWRLGAPYSLVTTLNIDAVTRWIFGGMPVDGLLRVLFYQQNHAIAWALGLSTVVLLLQARDSARVAVNAAAGLLLGAGLLISSFVTGMLAVVVGVVQAVRLVPRRQWMALAAAGIVGAVPMAVAVFVATSLEYVDPSGGSLVTVGRLNPLALHAAPIVLFLSFGPMLIGASVGAWLAVRRGARLLAVPALMIAVGVFFYFFVDVRDHQHVYVGWRSGHLLFMSFAPLVGFALQELWASTRRVRIITALVAGLVALAALPTTVIDIYNTQDTSNHGMAAGFRWTVILTPDELEALAWIKRSTPPDALVQIEPTVHDPETWSYIPTFAERRMVAGIPTSMIPLHKYEVASARIRDFFRDRDVASAYARARSLRLEYIYVGPLERDAYRGLDARLDGAPQWFQPVFRNNTVTIYRVQRGPG